MPLTTGPGTISVAISIGAGRPGGTYASLIAFFIETLAATLLLVLLFLIIYAPTIYGEEQFLRSTFPAFDSYAKRVPRLLPRLTPAHTEGDGSFSGTLYRQHREYNSVLGVCAVYAVLLAALWLRH